MPYSTSLLATITVGLVLAFVFGFAAARLHLPPLVGYLLAGIAIGPATPGLVGDIEIAGDLAELGIIFLMFGVGMNFSLRDLAEVRSIALPGALLQILVATALGTGFSRLWGWPLASGLVLGLALSVASTVVLVRAITQRGMLNSINGRIAVGWLVVEDLVMVLALVLLPAMANVLDGDPTAGSSTSLSLGSELALTIGKAAAFIALMLFIGKHVLPRFLRQVARVGLRELFTLSVIAVALGIAYGAAVLFGVSLALGAFFAGIVISESDLRHRASAESMPLQDAFVVLFFVSVGMLFNPAILIEQPLFIAALLAIVLIGKSLAAFAIVLAFGYPATTALTVSASLAQIGEFSFILAEVGISLDLLPSFARDIIVAVALITITLNVLAFKAIAPSGRWFEARPRLSRLLERSAEHLRRVPMRMDDPILQSHVILVGGGRVGQRIAQELRRHGVTVVIVDYNRQLVEQLRSYGEPAVYGNAALPGILERAGIDSARLLVVTAPDPSEARQIANLARTAKPSIGVIVRTHSSLELDWFAENAIGLAVMAEVEIASTITQHALDHLGFTTEEARSAAAHLHQTAVSGAAAVRPNADVGRLSKPGNEAADSADR